MYFSNVLLTDFSQNVVKFLYFQNKINLQISCFLQYIMKIFTFPPRSVTRLKMTQKTSIFGRYFFQKSTMKRSKNKSKICINFRPILGRFWTYFWTVFGALWELWASKRSPWGYVGTILGHLESSWGRLGQFLPIMKHLGSILDPFWSHVGAILVPFGVILHAQKAI